jgi:hypothetical protein
MKNQNERCLVFDFPKVSDPRGNLSFVEGRVHIPFEIKRIYYIYDVPGGSSRGGHAHKELQQVMIAISGSFDVTLDDGFNQKKYHLNRSYQGLYIGKMVWRELNNFSSGSVCLVLASELYEPSDYYYDYEKFAKKMKNY